MPAQPKPGHRAKTPGRQPGQAPTLRLVAWETTRRCNLACAHCRAAAQDCFYPGELTTQEGEAFLADLTKLGKPVVILTGGEPLLRDDIYHLAEFGHHLGLRMVMAVNGTLLSPGIARRLKESGVQRLSISLDGPDANSHDAFRGQPGAFTGALEGMDASRRAGLDFQINTTVTRSNLGQIADIQKLAGELGAVAHHIFLLVPTGRGRVLSGEIITAAEYEQVLNWFYDQRYQVEMDLKATCAPHYYRVLRQRAKERGEKVAFKTHGLDAVTKGCLGGQGFAFVSHVGQVQPCGYLETPAGNIKEQPFSEIWQESALFAKLRDPNLLGGKCGACEFRRVCGGCRARALENSGDVLAEEPLCAYNPPGYAG